MGLQGLSVMVVEDHGFQRRMAVRLLLDLGIRDPLEAADGGAALEVLEARTDRLDVIIVDLDMPGMDGVEFIGHVGDRGLARSVVVASAMDSALLGTVELIAHAAGLRVLGSIEKPLSAGKLAAVLSNHASTPGQDEAEPEALISAHMLREALDSEAFEPWFQPQAELVNGKVGSVEMLARWPRPGGGMIGPSRFIPMLENEDLIDRFTEQMLVRACRDKKQWEREGLRLRLSVNLCARSLAGAGVADRFERLVRDEGVEPADIVLELTEGSVICGTSASLSVLARLRLKGFGLSIDDFGTGYSSLARLSHVPFTELKIDRSFVHGAATQARKRAVIEASLELARKLGLRVVAEGVETVEEWALLAEKGCAFAQGYLIGKPAPAAQLPGVVERWRQPVL